MLSHPFECFHSVYSGFKSQNLSSQIRGKVTQYVNFAVSASEYSPIHSCLWTKTTICLRCCILFINFWIHSRKAVYIVRRQNRWTSQDRFINLPRAGIISSSASECYPSCRVASWIVEFIYAITKKNVQNMHQGIVMFDAN